jgi:hypothetical protein
VATEKAKVGKANILFWGGKKANNTKKIKAAVQPCHTTKPSPLTIPAFPFIFPLTKP